MALSGPAMGQAPPPQLPPIAPPNPVQQMAPSQLPRLSPSLEGPPLERQTGPGESLEVRIGGVRVSGNEAMPEARLGGALGGLAGATVPLSRIEEARLGILLAYREAGYPFVAVNAGVTRRPDGAVDLAFAVVEGYVAEVKLDADAAAVGPVATQVLRFLNRVVGVRPITSAALERALLLASDIPGLTVRGTLKPLQTEPGALELVVQVERKWYSGFANVDNRAYKLVGPWQGLLVGGLNSFTEYGERSEISLFGSPHSTQWFAQGSIDAFVGGSGLKLRAYGGGGTTTPSGPLRAVGYFGQSNVAGLVATYPVIRSRPLNLYAVASFDIYDNTIAQGTQINYRPVVSQDSVRAARFGGEGQALDTYVPWTPAAATSTISVRFSQGIEGLGATRTGDTLSSRSGGDNFGFTKVAGEIQRTQPVWAPAEGWQLNLMGLFGGQWSNSVLPVSEKYYLGGYRLGRGYFNGQITGDNAYAYSAELQLDLPTEEALDVGLGPIGIPVFRMSNQAYLFRDYGRTVENRDADPNRKVSSWGGGLRSVIDDRWQIDVEGVRRIVLQPDGAGTAKLNETAIYFRTLVRF